MATITDDELVQAAKTRLEEHLPAEVAAAGLEPVVEFLDYDPPLTPATKTPQIWVDLTSVQPSSDSDRGATVQKYASRPQLLVGVVIAGNDPSQAARNLRKLVDLVRRVMEADQTLGGISLWVRCSGRDYTPNMGKPGTTSLLKACFLSFDINYRTQIGRE